MFGRKAQGETVPAVPVRRDRVMRIMQAYMRETDAEGESPDAEAASRALSEVSKGATPAGVRGCGGRSETTRLLTRVPRALERTAPTMTEPSQVWLPRSGVMITCCPAHETRTGPRRTHAEVQEMAECANCTRETLAPPLAEDPGESQG